MAAATVKWESLAAGSASSTREVEHQGFVGHVVEMIFPVQHRHPPRVTDCRSSSTHDRLRVRRLANSANADEHPALPRLSKANAGVRLRQWGDDDHGDVSDVAMDCCVDVSTPEAPALHAYPTPIHRLTYRRSNLDDTNLRGYKQYCAIATAFEMKVLDDLHRFERVTDILTPLPQVGVDRDGPGRALRHERLERRLCIDENFQGNAEICERVWGAVTP